MVRNMVGLLLEIGSGKRKYDCVKEILLAEDRTKAGITIDPNGLYLEDVYYE
jgi:tRNA pseudouridine38-40 synthase